MAERPPPRSSRDPGVGGKGGPQEGLGLQPGTAAKPIGEYSASHTQIPTLPGVLVPCPVPHPFPHSTSSSPICTATAPGNLSPLHKAKANIWDPREAAGKGRPWDSLRAQNWYPGHQELQYCCPQETDGQEWMWGQHRVLKNSVVWEQWAQGKAGFPKDGTCIRAGALNSDPGCHLQTVRLVSSFLPPSTMRLKGHSKSDSLHWSSTSCVPPSAVEFICIRSVTQGRCYAFHSWEIWNAEKPCFLRMVTG